MQGSRPTVTVAPRTAASCLECGRVEKIEVVQGVRTATRGGAVLGGVVGGVLTGPGKETSPRAGNPMQKSYRLTIRMDNGRRMMINQKIISANLRAGSTVRLNNGRVVLLR